MQVGPDSKKNADLNYGDTPVGLNGRSIKSQRAPLGIVNKPPRPSGEVRSDRKAQLTTGKEGRDVRPDPGTSDYQLNTQEEAKPRY